MTADVQAVIASALFDNPKFFNFVKVFRRAEGKGRA